MKCEEWVWWGGGLAVHDISEGSGINVSGFVCVKKDGQKGVVMKLGKVCARKKEKSRHSS